MHSVHGRAQHPQWMQWEPKIESKVKVHSEHKHVNDDHE